jgi:hypothetical protein
MVLNGNIAEGLGKLWQAVEWSRSRDTRLFEVRALRYLVRLGIRQDQHKEAIAALRYVINWFPQKLEIPDLKEARDALQAV